MKAKAVQLLVNSFLPEDLQDLNADYSTKGLNSLLYKVATKYPDRFAEINKKISDIGRNASWYRGETITLQDLIPSIDRQKYYDAMDAELAQLSKSDKDYATKRNAIFQKYNEAIEKDSAKASLQNRNNIALSVLSGARGKSAQLKAMSATPGTYSDYKGDVVPIFSKESFADGMRPATYAASTNGSRASVVSTKSSTAKGGDWAKQMAATAADMIVRKTDCGTHNGVAFSLDDPSLKGRVLAHSIGGYDEGEFITKEMINDLNKKGINKLVARSALTCGVHNGLCAKCVGKYYNGGKLPKIGDDIGAIVATSVSEPVTQMALCLYENTEVRMADNSVKLIKDIIPGDMVLGSDKNGNTQPVRVLDRFKQGVKVVYKFTFQRDDLSSISVVCTSDHKFLQTSSVWADNRILPIVPNDSTNQPSVVCDTGKATLIDKSVPYQVMCYDIEVDHPDHLFVLANGLITSNSAKHTAGMTQSKRTYSGLPVIQQFTQSPEKFKDKGVVSELDGIVEDIQEAAQGGHYITIDGEKHYTPAGHEVQVKRGQQVYAGDQLSEGLVDAEDIVRLKGLGSGRKYYAERLNKILADSGAASDKRSTEVLARAALRHVRVTNNEGLGNYLPDDIIDYNVLQDSYRLPETSRLLNANNAIGKFLQQPALHYTIGTRVTPNVAKELNEAGYGNIYVDDMKPEFEPEMIRLRASSHTNPDWMASLGTSYLTKQLNESATKADDTNVLHNPDYRPRLAFGKDFGVNVEQTGEF